MDEAEFTAPIYDKVTAELTGVVAVRVRGLFPRQPGFEINPARPQGAGSPVGTFQSIGLVGDAVTVKQDCECPTDFVHPLLEGGECSERNDENAGIEFGKFFLVVAQLRGMFAAGNSAQVTEKDQQGVSAFENFAQRDLLAIGGGEGEGGGGVI